MSTKVFISWSGDLSEKLASALRDWLPSALQFVKPYFTPADIEKGARWNPEISNELETSNIGIICLTQDNMEKPWILFEAGALSKITNKSFVCTLLFGIEPTDVTGPLLSFQATKFIREDFKKLIETINNYSGELKLESRVINDVFEMWWPKLEEKISEIIGTHDKVGAKKHRTDRDIIEEILHLVRMNSNKIYNLPELNVKLFSDIVTIYYNLERAIDNQDNDMVREMTHIIGDLLNQIIDETSKTGIPNLKAQLLSKIQRKSNTQSASPLSM